MADQEQARQEDLMAGGPVSRGASNQDAPMYSDTGNTGQKNNQDYNKLLQQRSSGTPEGSGAASTGGIGTPGGSSLPENTTGTSSTGGMATSNSTISGGGSASGSVIGGGSTTDRGSMTTPDTDASTNVVRRIDINSQENPGEQGQEQHTEKNG